MDSTFINKKFRWTQRTKKSPENEAFQVLSKFLSTQIYLLFCFNTKGQIPLSKNNMFRKNLVLELWSKKLKAIQNAGFFELVYLTNKVRYEVEFLDVTRGP